MIQGLLLLFEGGLAWDRIVRKTKGFASVFLYYLLPMMLIATVVEGLGLAHWGKWQPNLVADKRFSTNEVIGYEAGQFALNLIMILVCALLFRSLGRTFHGRLTYTFARSFTAVAYSLSPMFLCDLLNAFPSMNPYIPWSIGIVLSIWVLYDGLPRLMAPDPTHALGLYLSCSIVLLMATALVRVITGLYVQGSVGFIHTFLGRKLMDLMGN